MADLVNVFPGQCRLRVVSASQLSLDRFQGSYVPIKFGGVWQAKFIPSVAPVLSNVGLVAGQLNYIYGFDSAGVITLEASLTGHSPDSTVGVEVKTGDPTRTLFGMVQMGAGSPGTFINSVTQRYLANWFNRRRLAQTNMFTTGRSTASTTFAEINTEIRVEFLDWGEEGIHVGAAGTANNNTAGNATATAIGIDGIVASVATSFTQPGGGNNRGPFGIWAIVPVTEGLHYATLLGGVSGGTGDWASADAIASGVIATRLFAAAKI